MNWRTFPMGAAANERAYERKFKTLPHLSHAVNTDTWRPLCKVKLTSLCVDDSFYKVGELPECPACLRAIKEAGAQ
jgi:hypothetical protein